MNRVTQPLSTSRSGFSLIELAIVMAIIIALAGIVTPRLSGFADKADYARAGTDMKGIKKALQLLYLDVGYYPPDQNRGIDPGLNDPARVPSAQRADWKGPYLETWTGENPWGGSYDYEYWNEPAFDFDGVAGNEVFISVRGGLDTTMAQRLDEIIDDGDTSTGMARSMRGTFLLFVGEGRRW